MTDMEAWNVIAPILAAHMNPNGRLDALDRSYVLAYAALREYDKNRL